jgi:hypothetical protein
VLKVIPLLSIGCEGIITVAFLPYMPEEEYLLLINLLKHLLGLNKPISEPETF